MVRLALTTTALLAIVIAVLSLYPVPPLRVPGSDKTYHFLAYAALVLPISMARPLYAPLIFLIASFYGLAIEFVQPATGRMFESEDLVANTLGAAAGSIIGLCLGFIAARMASRGPSS